MAVDAAAAAAQTTSATGMGKARLADNFETFLTLLTSQLKNQDPLSPLDSNQFTQQLVQMSGVEQQLLTNDLLEKLVANDSRGIGDAVALIGKQVRAVSADAALKDGKAEWAYKLDRAAADVKIEVLDSKGVVVHSEAVADAPAGESEFTWNGKGANGKSLPDGTYTLKITAADSQGSAVTNTIYVQGVVTGVEQTDGKTLISLGGTKVDWTTVTSINQAEDESPTTAAADPDNTNNPDDEDPPSQAAA